jgi:hypothetical protein
MPRENGIPVAAKRGEEGYRHRIRFGNNGFVKIAERASAREQATKAAP